LKIYNTNLQTINSLRKWNPKISKLLEKYKKHSSLKLYEDLLFETNDTMKLIQKMCNCDVKDIPQFTISKPDLSSIEGVNKLYKDIEAVSAEVELCKTDITYVFSEEEVQPGCDIISNEDGMITVSCTLPEKGYIFKFDNVDFFLTSSPKYAFRVIASRLEDNCCHDKDCSCLVLDVGFEASVGSFVYIGFVRGSSPCPRLAENMSTAIAFSTNLGVKQLKLEDNASFNYGDRTVQALVLRIFTKDDPLQVSIYNSYGFTISPENQELANKYYKEIREKYMEEYKSLGEDMEKIGKFISRLQNTDEVHGFVKLYENMTLNIS